MSSSRIHGKPVIRYTNREIAQPTPRLSDPVSSQAPLSSSWHIRSETESSLDTFTTGSANPEQPAYTNMNSDFACRDDCYYGRGFFPPARGYDASVIEHPSDFPSSLPQPFVTSPSDTTDPLLPGTAASPIIFTDNARMRLGDLIRRQCFNCRATETRTWRRSVLNPGKMVCNKCGLFERSHASPRPNTLPHKHRLRPTPVYPDMDPASDRVENSQLNGRPFTDSFTGHFSNAFGSPGEATTPHDTTWVNHSVFPTTSHRTSGPSHTISPHPSTYHVVGFHPPSTAPAETAYPPSHLGVSRHPPGVVENWCFDSAS